METKTVEIENESERLKWLRNFLDMSQSEFAEMLGTKQQVIAMIENNKREVPKSIRTNFYNLYRVSYDEAIRCSTEKELFKLLLNKYSEYYTFDKSEEKERVWKILNKISDKVIPNGLDYKIKANCPNKDKPISSENNIDDNKPISNKNYVNEDKNICIQNNNQLVIDYYKSCYKSLVKQFFEAEENKKNLLMDLYKEKLKEVCKDDYDNCIKELEKSLNNLEEQKNKLRNTERKASSKENNEYIISIPLHKISAAAGAGTWLDDEPDVEKMFFDKRFLKQIIKTNNYDKLHIIYAKGDSMDSGWGQPDDIKDGDLLIIDTSQTTGNNQIFVIKVNKSELRVKRLFKKNNALHIQSNNPNYEEEIYYPNDNNDTEIEVIGRVVWNGSKESI